MASRVAEAIPMSTPHDAPELPDELILDDAETTRRLLKVKSRSVHYLGMQSGRFAKPIKTGNNTNAWVRARTLEDIKRMIAEADAKSSPSRKLTDARRGAVEESLAVARRRK
jgi:predicted DNA-binding transcriptional regulator AlpA